MGMPFFFQIPSFSCLKTIDGEKVYVPCDESEACKNLKETIFSDQTAHSLSRELNLYCERHFLLGLSASLFFIGYLFIFWIVLRFF